ncbi:MAG: hypothetical protein KC613_11835, partial [Myxococcales bacterium]|nr:hypothetical protein [Myxococcales bacterium]
MTPSRPPQRLHEPSNGPASATPEGLMVRLRRETRADHDRIEALPFSRAVARGELPADAFATYLDSLLALRTPLEAAAAMCDHPGVQRVWGTMAAHAGVLIADLRTLRRGGVVSKLPPRIPLALRSDIEATAHSGEAGLVGLLYVAAGSWHGVRLVERAVRRMGEVRVDELRSFAVAGPAYADSWRAFAQAVDGALPPSDHGLAVAAARRAFGHMTRAL